MKRIIKSYTGNQYVFDFCDNKGFSCCMFACLAGLPKRVSVSFDGDDEVYLVALI